MKSLSSPVSRRAFLERSIAAGAGTVVAIRDAGASDIRVIPVRSTLPPTAFVRTSIPVSMLQTLAHRAVGAARDAGATYADVRVAERHTLVPSSQRVIIRTQFTYGVRALLGGVWGFSYGRAPTVDGVTQCAREAVSGARMTAYLSERSAVSAQHDWIPAPVVSGEWHMPIRIDPFDVPVQQQAEALGAIEWTVAQTPAAHGGIDIEWWKETRAFAATTGSMVVQHRYQADVTAGAYVDYGTNVIAPKFHGVQSAAAGYEILQAADLQERCKAAAEEAARLAALPVRTLDIGRYPVVFDGSLSGMLLLNIIGPSVELDRVLGRDIDAAGISRWSVDALGTSVAGKLMTVTGQRGMPFIGAVQWDDEGMSPREHTILHNGVLVDYHTSGDTVSTLQQWYHDHDRPLQANGCAIAPTADTPVAIRSPHLAMSPATERVSLDDLCADARNGIAVLSHGWIDTDGHLTSGSLNSRSQIFEISRGKIVRRIKGVVLQFNTRPFLKGLLAVGDATTVHHQESQVNKGIPWQSVRQSATAPAAYFKELNVISAGRA